MYKKKNRIIEFNFLKMTSEIRDVIELFTFGGVTVTHSKPSHHAELQVHVSLKIIFQLFSS